MKHETVVKIITKNAITTISFKCYGKQTDLEAKKMSVSLFQWLNNDQL